MKKDRTELHDLLVEGDRVELRRYASYLLQPDHDRTLVLTAHLVAERLLEGMISTVLVYPDAWIREADFRSKLSLAKALALIEQREVNICKVLNSARNAIAHTLDPLPDKWRKEMERLAYGRASGIRWKKGVAKDLNQILRVPLALIASRLLQAKFKTHLGRLRQEHGEQWKSLWVETMLANMELFGNQEEEARLAEEVDLTIAKELQKEKMQDGNQKKKD
jgi:hypothetical protein